MQATKEDLINASYQFTRVFKFAPKEVRIMRLATRAIRRGQIERAKKLCQQTTITRLCWQFAEEH